ncbi:BREX-2 system phosphatase PglZ [Actinacidiphila oryziradicis]|uniref:BREX-2 system phosphatase PglZ n=1 Tax=Actinacidiphila oryziradicis TaxID=2571141 RepID=A0A4U0S6T4_9ACTN|nr:BREX-2 system phosphatase PglZ [Actinacidiphila oryziradicis]TKA04732.1 BREX-2 system phosphatase PglZ [Actinacidiphila oryziradicis]
MTQATSGTAVPEIDQRAVEALLWTALPHAKGCRLVLVSGRYREGAPAEFTTRLAQDRAADGEPQQRRIHVSHQSSVLGIVDAWQNHLARHADAAGGGDVLVVTTDAPDTRPMPLDLRGEAIGRSLLTVDRVEIVKQRFGAVDVDPRIRREPWLADALLAAEPAGGWLPVGSVLTLDAAMHALVHARIGLGDGVSTDAVPLDVEALLTWSRTPGGPARFTELQMEERAGLTGWLERAVGDSAPLLLALAQAGRGGDAMALGVVAAVLTGPRATPDAALAVGALFGSVPFRPDELRHYTRAVEGVLARWITQATAGGPRSAEARTGVLQVLEQADGLADRAGLREALADSVFLPSGFRARLRALAATLTPRPGQRAVAAAEAALHQLRGHHLADLLFPEQVQLAEMAVRLQRWLTTGQAGIAAGSGAVNAAVHAHLGDWGWADRALNRLWAGDGAADPHVNEAYRIVHDAARARRDHLDRDFAQALATWTQHATSTAPEGALLVEDVLRRIAVPLAAQRPPLILLLDGMSSAVAAQLGEELGAPRWTEAAPEPGRRAAAVAAIPSVTTVSRATLLTGALVRGGQSVEKDGFAAFWRKRRHEAVLFHKAELPGPAGHRLAPEVIAAIAGDGVVGVVLNTIDDALDHGQESSRGHWTASSVRYLSELLDAARGQGRPVVLVADHGHVLDRTLEGPLPAQGVESARWRIGRPGEQSGEDEIQLAGPRVLEGGGTLTALWREDQRYTPRKAGYHGGAALAEMTVPVLVLLPSAEILPPGWSVLSPEAVTPPWWHDASRTGANAAAVPPAKTPTNKKKTKPAADDLLFQVPGAAPAPASPLTLGAKVVDTGVYAAQKQFVRKGPEKKAVAAVIDHLAEADGTLSLAAVSAAAASSGGRAPRNAEFFVAALQRLLNVEGYPVLGLIDAGARVRLDIALLKDQFGVTA